MPAVRGRVDQHNSVASPPEIPAPEVSVQSGRTILVVEITSATTHNEALKVSASWWVEPRVRAFGHRRQPLVSVEAPPACVLRQRHRQGAAHGPEVSRPAPSLRRRSEGRCARIVGAGQPATEFVGAHPIGFDEVEALQRQAGGVMTDHANARNAGFRCPEPAQSGCLARKESLGSARVSLDEGWHASSATAVGRTCARGRRAPGSAGSS